MHDPVLGELLERVRRVLYASMRGLDPALIEDSVEDALLMYINNPTVYRNNRSSLLTFLVTVARRRVIDRLRRERAAARRRRGLLLEYERLAPSTRPEDDRPTITLGCVPLTAPERAFLDAKLQGERSTRRLAMILGLADFSAGQQRREVKRVMDRIRARIRRARLREST